MTMVFSMASEIERDLISKRTRESLASRKKAGVKLGRPKGPGKSKLDKYKPEIEALLNNDSTQKFIANRYQVNRGQVQRLPGHYFLIFLFSLFLLFNFFLLSKR